MPGSQADSGVTNSARITGDNIEPVASFSAVLDSYADSHPELSQCQLAARLGLTEQTFRRYRRGDQTPDFCRLQAMLSRPNTGDLRFRVCLLVAGGRLAVIPIEAGERVNPADQAHKLRELAIEAGEAPIEAQKAVTRALADGRVSADELVQITNATQQGRAKLDDIDAAAAELHRSTQRR
jgi:transcriptional regulator with XRE-family HTH domain